MIMYVVSILADAAADVIVQRHAPLHFREVMRNAGLNPYDYSSLETFKSWVADNELA